MATRPLGYCTNVHAGSNLESTRASLLEHAVKVRQVVSGAAPLGIGLWLSSAALAEIARRDRAERFSDWLGEHGLTAYTMNGFPWGDFHDSVVKRAVYEPNWIDPRRLHYTLGLVDFLDALLPAGAYGSISTLPIAWGAAALTEGELAVAAAALLQVVRRLESLEQQSGRLICLALEPEPGCVLQRSSDVVDFFERFLPTKNARRYLGVCHDVCHAGVMFERQVDVFRAYREAGIRVAKVQISSSLKLTVDEATSAAERAAAIAELATFAEDRYLHQTCVSIDGGKPRFFEDLPQALQSIDSGRQAQEWRVHFHLPIHLESLGHLQTGQDEILRCLDEIELGDETIHLEVETYAWNVLPEELRPEKLYEGIAEELLWLGARLEERDGMAKP